MFRGGDRGQRQQQPVVPRLQTLALANRLEIANHGATHTDADTPQRLREEIV